MKYVFGRVLHTAAEVVGNASVLRAEPYPQSFRVVVLNTRLMEELPHVGRRPQPSIGLNKELGLRGDIKVGLRLWIV